MITEKSTIVVEMSLNEEKTERYLYKRVWSKAKAPKLACVMTIHPGSSDPNSMDLTTMLIANAINEMGYDGFLGVNLTSKLQQKRKISASDYTERDRWDDYTVAYEDALNRCSTKESPWYVIPANEK